MAVGIDRRSIPPAGDNRSVSASTDPNSYLSPLTASMAQLTTGTQFFFFLLFQAPIWASGWECVLGAKLTFCIVHWLRSPEVNINHNTLTQLPFCVNAHKTN